MKRLESNDQSEELLNALFSNPPLAVGEPFFYSVESAMSHIIFSIPAIKGIEFGAGFAAASMRGSQHNDPFIDKRGKDIDK